MPCRAIGKRYFFRVLLCSRSFHARKPLRYQLHQHVMRHTGVHETARGLVQMAGFGQHQHLRFRCNVGLKQVIRMNGTIDRDTGPWSTSRLSQPCLVGASSKSLAGREISRDPLIFAVISRFRQRLKCDLFEACTRDNEAGLKMHDLKTW